MQKKYNSKRRKRGRPKEPLEVEVELIESEEGTRRWEEIFKLLEYAGKLKPSDDPTDSLINLEYDQLSLF